MYWPIGAADIFALTKHVVAAPTGDDELGSEPEATRDDDSNVVVAVEIWRGGNMFATTTRSTLAVWQTKPTVALAAVVRSKRSLNVHGPSSALLLRPDGRTIMVQTALGYLITYTLEADGQVRVYHPQLSPFTAKHLRKDSSNYSSFRRPETANPGSGPGEQDGIRNFVMQFGAVVRIGNEITKAIALDDGLIISCANPTNIRCIPWAAGLNSPQVPMETLDNLSWLQSAEPVTEMTHDKPMNLSCWLTGDGRAFAVQRQKQSPRSPSDMAVGNIQGFCFKNPTVGGAGAVKVAINARFSLIAIACANNTIELYTVKDYTGNIPLSRSLTLPPSASHFGSVTHLSYSPDGHCLFSGFEHGWALWSVYGKLGATSADGHNIAEPNSERYLNGVSNALWMAGGCELLILPPGADFLWVLEMARNACVANLLPANVSQGLLHSSDAVVVYRGHDGLDLTSVAADAPLWQTIQVPNSYLVTCWPIKLAAISANANYIAVAGRRGIAHYSVASGRWKQFDDPDAEQSFAVRGGMCWHHNLLFAAVECRGRYQLRVFVRDKPLERPVHTERLPAPAILTTTSGTESLLVYTHDNLLLHYIIVRNDQSVRLVQVGQIGFHGIVRAPPRVRAISWILPEAQLEHGDPSHDVAKASVLFLVDGKLVLLQPSTNEHDELKYNMRVIAHDVEHYIFMRDQPAAVAALKGPPILASLISCFPESIGHSLRDSLWFFDGEAYHVWPEVQDVLASAPVELGRDLPPTVRMPLDFYPVAPLISRGVIHGLEADLVWRKDVNLSLFRLEARTELFLPQLLRHHLSEYNSPAALHLAGSYQHLPYFAHALEVLLHEVLDSEVDRPPSPPETALLPSVNSFLSSFPAYLDIIVNCTRKTELRSWRTLFSYLPPVRQLFEDSMSAGKLKTAAGYLLVLHSFEEEIQLHEFASLFSQASESQQWDLCSELARFLAGIDPSGRTLSEALVAARLRNRKSGNAGGLSSRSLG
ncbi:RIC1-domain-containing protein [Piedraia hortae CBS 480.64]|uniref:RIC1-domain-containing protein n=1 Tax=Piedraia hortae CBS 480.64 TaxID=1314780 RepID=A0A6A7BX89_9PEZI|nr:RIC1-domain-containing protein [Piedraia hortae CBS 480.64]